MNQPQQQPPPHSMPLAAPQPKRYDGTDAPKYDVGHGGHYGAAAALAATGHAPPPETFTGHWGNVSITFHLFPYNTNTPCQVSNGLAGPYRDTLNTYWQNQVSDLETNDHDYKLHQLPLARIKKVMKADPDVKMISAEAPILFAKACDIFITELTMRAWIHAEENKRRTLQRSDIASALAKSDMFDFLIDIVPREDATPQHKRRPDYAAVGTYQVPDPSGAAAAGGAPQGVEQAPMQPQPEYAGLEPHMQPAPHYTQQMGAYPPPTQQYAGQQMFNPNLYGQQNPYPMQHIEEMNPNVSRQ